MTEPEAELRGKHIVFYDGVCALCNGTVRFLLRRDDHDRFRFAALQGEPAERLLAPYPVSPEELGSMLLLTDFGTPQAALHREDDGVFEMLRRLGPPWSWLSALDLLPGFLTRRGYRLVARLRYRLFGEYESCPLPPPDLRHRFL